MKSLGANLIAILALAFMMSSCGKTIDIGKVDDMKGLNEIINEKLPKDSKVTYLSLSCSTSSSVGWEIENISIRYITSQGERRSQIVPVSGNSQFYDSEDKSPAAVDIPTKQFVGGQIVEVTPPKRGRSIADYDFTIVAKNIDKVMHAMGEKGYDTINGGVDDYSITLYEDPSLDTHSLTLLNKAGNAKLQGKSIVTEYEEWKFWIDASGNMKDNVPDKE